MTIIPAGFVIIIRNARQLDDEAVARRIFGINSKIYTI